MGRSRIAEDFRHGQPLFVSFLHGYAHDFTMDGDVVGDVLTTGLHGLLRNHAFTLLQQLFCQHAGGDGFADVRVYAADEVKRLSFAVFLQDLYSFVGNFGQEVV